MAAAGEHQIVSRHYRAAVKHQTGDLLPQLAAPGQLVVVQHFAEVMLDRPAQFAPDRLQAWLCDIRRAAAEGDNRFIVAGVEHGQHLIPLGDLHRALYRTRHRRHRRLGLAGGDEIARSRLRYNHLLLLKQLIGLLDGADADAVLLAQAAHRRQFFAVAIQALFDAFGQQRSEMLVTGHAVSLISAIQME